MIASAIGGAKNNKKTIPAPVNTSFNCFMLHIPY